MDSVFRLHPVWTHYAGGSSSIDSGLTRNQTREREIHREEYRGEWEESLLESTEVHVVHELDKSSAVMGWPESKQSKCEEIVSICWRTAEGPVTLQ